MKLRKKQKRKPTEFSPEERARREESARAAAAVAKQRALNKKKWRRTKIAGTVVAILVVFRLVLGLAIPTIVDSVAKRVGMRATYDSMFLSLLWGSLEVSNLELRTRTDDEMADLAADPVVRVDSIDFDLDASRLLAGTIAVHSAELDGLHAWLSRDADGRVLVGETVLTSGRVAEDENVDRGLQAAGAPVERSEVFDFGLGFECALLRMSDARVHWLDRSVEPPVAVALDASLRVEQLGHPEVDTRLAMRASIDEVLGALHLDGTFKGLGPDFSMRTTLRIDGLRPRKVEPLLATLGARLHGDEFDARVDATIDLEPVDRDVERPEAPALALRGVLATSELWLRVDRETPVRVDRVVVPIDRWTVDGVELAQVSVDGVFVDALRQEDGRVVVGGVSRVEHDEEDPRAVEDTSAESFAILLSQLELRDARVQFADRAITPHSNLELEVLEATVDDLELGSVVADESPPPVRLDAQLRLPGVLRELHVAASFAPAPGANAEIQFEGSGLRPTALEPYLHALGLGSELTDADVKGSVHAAWATEPDDELLLSLSVLDFALRDGEDLLRVDEVIIDSLSVTETLVRVGKIAVSGHPVRVRRDADGAIHALGFHTRAPSNLGAARASGDGEVVAVEKPSLRIDDFNLCGLAIAFVDEAVDPAQTHRIDDLIVDAKKIGIGSRAPREDGSLSIGFRAGTLASRLEANATTRLSTLPYGIRGKLGIEKLSGRDLDAYLRPLGLELEIEDGSLDCGFDANLSIVEDDTLRVGGRVADFVLADATNEFAKCKSITFDGVELAPGSIDLGSWTIESPRVRVLRDSSAEFVVAGVRLHDAVEGAADAQPPTPAATSPALRLGSLRVLEAHALWRDEAIDPVVDTDLRLLADIGRWDSRGSGEATPFQVEIAAGTSVDSILLQGVLASAPQLALRAKLEGDGLRGGDLAPYLPANLHAEARAGRLRGAIEVRFETGTATSPTASHLDVRADDVDFREAGAQRAWFAAPSTKLRITRDGAHWNLAEARVSGLDCEIRKGVDGDLRMLGMRFLSSETDTKAEVPEAESTGGGSRSADPAPTVEIGKVALDIASLRYRDDSIDGESIDLACELRLPESFVFLRPDTEGLQPLSISVKGRVAPFVRAFEGQVALAPFASEPSVKLSLTGRGLQGDGLVRYAPSLAGRMDTDALEGASFRVEAESSLRMRRRRATDFPFPDGFGIEARVTELALRSADETVLASIDKIEAEVKSVLPRTGAVHVTSVHVSKPTVRVIAEADAMQIAGVRFHDQPAPIATSSAPARAEEIAPATSNTGEVRVDLFAIDGVDFAFEDRTATPAVVAPIRSLDAEVKGFTTRAFNESVPISFHVFAEGGALELPERVQSGLLGGMLGAVASAIGGDDDKFKVEKRPFFGELAVQGRLVLHPEPQGFIKTSLDSLELPAIRGLAKKAGFEIGDGVLDSGVQLRFLGADGMEVETKSTFTNLSLDEPPDGPISTYLKLPAPLDTVLFVLRNENGEHVVPFSFDVPPTGVGTASVVSAAVSSLAQIILKAIAASPFRIVGGVVDLAGAGGDAEKPDPEAPVVEFEAADAVIDSARTDGLKEAIAALQADEKLVLVLRHRFGPQDFARADVLANPSADEAAALARRLRIKKDALLARRAQLSTQAKTHFELEQSELAASSSAAIRALDVEFAQTERALDRLYELLRRGADRRRVGRTKRFALEIAALRLAAVKSALLQRGVPETRIELRRARVEPVESGSRAQVSLEAKARQVP